MLTQFRERFKRDLSENDFFAEHALRVHKTQLLQSHISTPTAIAITTTEIATYGKSSMNPQRRLFIREKWTLRFPDPPRNLTFF